MKKTSFLKKLTAMAATLAMTCVMAVGAFAAGLQAGFRLHQRGRDLDDVGPCRRHVRLES